VFTDADLEYLSSEFVELRGLCAAAGRDIDEVRRAIAQRLSPAPPYPGVEYMPANYFQLPDAEEFRRTFTGDHPAENLTAYLDGTYFVCLRNATVENIARKGELVDEIRALRFSPRPDDATWRVQLHSRVDELDRLERPFSPDFDRSRFGRPVTRDELIEDSRRLYPLDTAA